MNKAWFYSDPECGVVRDEFGGTTLAADNNDWYFQGPKYAAWLLYLVSRLHACTQGWIYSNWGTK